MISTLHAYAQIEGCRTVSEKQMHRGVVERRTLCKFRNGARSKAPKRGAWTLEIARNRVRERQIGRVTGD